jgi:hypothetical protein
MDIKGRKKGRKISVGLITRNFQEKADIKRIRDQNFIDFEFLDK